MAPPPDAHLPSRMGSRALLVLAGSLLLGEYLIVSLLYDAQSVVVRGGIWRWFGRVGELGPLLITTASAWFLLFRLAPNARVGEQPNAGRDDRAPVPRAPWLLVHMASAGASLVLSQHLFAEQKAPAGPAVLWIVAWLSGVLLTGASSLLGVLGGARWLRVLFRDSRIAVPLGVVAWLAGLWTSSWWTACAAFTLEPSAALLRALTGGAHAEVPRSMLFLETWAMRVTPGCGGMEGLGVWLVLTVAYLVRFHRRLRLPRALLVFLGGMALLWAGNVVRFAVLSIIGNLWGARVAVAGFHSKSSWLLFGAIALGSAWAARRWANKEAEPRTLAG